MIKLKEYPVKDGKRNTMCHYCKLAKLHDPEPDMPIARCTCTLLAINKYTGNRVALETKNMGNCPFYKGVR